MSRKKRQTILKVPKEIILYDTKEKSEYPKSMVDTSIIPMLYCFFYFRKGLDNRCCISIVHLTQCLGFKNPSEADYNKVANGVNELIRLKAIKMIGQNTVRDNRDLIMFKFCVNNNLQAVKNNSYGVITVDDFETITYYPNILFRERAWVYFTILLYIRLNLWDAYNNDEECYYSTYLDMSNKLNISNTVVGKVSNELDRLGLIEVEQVYIKNCNYEGKLGQPKKVTTNRFCEPIGLFTR